MQPHHEAIPPKLGFPESPEGHRASAEVDFHQMLGRWDRHVTGCGECLSYGTHLCREGEYLSEEVVLGRSRFALRLARISQVVPPSGFGRILARGRWALLGSVSVVTVERVTATTPTSASAELR